MTPRPPLLVRLAFAAIRTVSWLVPRRDRAEWRREWTGEVLHGHLAAAERREDSLEVQMSLFRRALGSFRDAAWLRRQFTRDSEILADLRHTLRLYRHSPSMVALIVVVLALAIGASTAVFSAVEAVLLRPLPYADAERIVMVWQQAPQSPGKKEVSPGNFLDWRDRVTSFEAFAGAEPYGRDYTGDGPPVSLSDARVTEGFFDALRIEPALGRLLSARDFELRQNVVVLSHSLWQRRFGSDPNVVGRSIRLDDQSFEVVGVLPDTFEPRILGAIDIWTPKTVIEDYERRSRGGGYWQVVAKLKPGVAEAAASAELDAISRALEREHPRTNQDVRAWVMPLRTHVAGGAERALLLLGLASACVLVLAAASVANLLLTLLSTRVQEFSVRTALGASRARLGRQVLLESATLSGLASLAGLGLSWFMLTTVRAVNPLGLEALDRATVNASVVLFALGTGALTTLLAAALPIASMLSAGAATRLRGGLQVRTRAASPAFAQGSLVVVQIALALILLVSAGLLGRSLQRLVAVDPGLSTENLLALQVFAYDRQTTAERRIAFFNETIARIRRVPGVELAGAASTVPFLQADIDIESPLTIPGRTIGEGNAPRIYLTAATTDYFAAAGIPLRRGRLFTADDTLRTRDVGLLNETAAARFWPGEDPLGRTIEVSDTGRPTKVEIVGIVGDLRYGGLDQSPRAELFMPHAQSPTAGMTYVVRTSADPSSLLKTVQEQVWSVDPLQTFYEAGPVSDMLLTTLRPRLFTLRLIAMFSGVAFLLAVAGAYGAVSFAMRRRTAEFGVRLALGASPAHIRSLVLGYGGRLAAAGITLGLVCALALTGLMRAFLFEVTPTDHVTFVTLSLVLAAAVLAACYLPARRAVRVDPVTALRE